MCKKKLLAPYVAMKRPQWETNWSFGSGWQKKKRRVQSKNYCKGNNDDESSCGVVPA